ncbi:Predicted small secreted protein [Alkalibacterium subtropicum]|uniref:Predicted small secreted protein n=1 Tax=Alkalibacterium subtropicum TaxID=753702 RepID=A0A1I1EA56_9LACT|nr:Predicted small secreted protein [Alkalibacterium subtropicum]
MFHSENLKRSRYSSQEWSLLSLVLVLSFLVGALSFRQYSKKKALKADDILKTVKKDFLEEGSIEGSWIELTKVPWKKFAHKTDVYYGGISRYEDNKLAQYEFIADAYTGSILDIYRV